MGNDRFERYRLTIFFAFRGNTYDSAPLDRGVSEACTKRFSHKSHSTLSIWKPPLFRRLFVYNLLVKSVCCGLLPQSQATIVSTSNASSRHSMWTTVWNGLAQAETTTTTPNGKTNKLTNIPDDELAEKIRGDVVDRQFLVTANLSRELYDESSTFTDEIDTYELEKWIKGTQRLFVASKSHVDLEPGSLTVDKSEVVFRFSEYLCFNIPLLQPVVDLTGKVVLKRDPETGLITSYQEFWDQDVASVLKTAKFFG